MDLPDKTIFVLHEFYIPSHFIGLEELCRSRGYRVEYFEIPSVKSVLTALLPPFRRFRHELGNWKFLFSLKRTKGLRIVLGLAPYNYVLMFLRPLFRRHRIFYHTSYTCWDGTRMAHSSLYPKYMRRVWKSFVGEEVDHIFAVSGKTKSELISNDFSVEDKISVVNHAYKSNDKRLDYSLEKKNRSFLYVGRLIACKGIMQLLEYFAVNPDIELNIAGDGDLRKYVIQSSRKYANIKYHGFVSEWGTLSELYRRNTFLLLNSRRTGEWEELFGMAVIEAMRYGCIPVCTDHSGPKEIIRHGVDGFLFTEDEYIGRLDDVRKLPTQTIESMGRAAINASGRYSEQSVAKKWESIFE